MSTIPPIPPILTGIASDVTAPLTWLQKHERIVIVFLVLVAGLFLGNRWLNFRAAHDKQVADLAMQQLTAQKTKDAQLAAQVTQLNGQYQVVVAQLSQQNEKLAAAIGSRTIVLQQQQATDKTMPLTDLGTHWASLVGIAATDISASPAGGIDVSDTGARQTVEQLDRIPALSADLNDETTVANNRQQEVDKANNLIDGLNLEVSSLNTTIKTEGATCKAEIESANATANKAKAKWFKVGFVAGFISGLFVGHSV